MKNISYIINEAILNKKKLFADFIQTERNRQMFITYRFSNFEIKEEKEDCKLLFESKNNEMQKYPQYIKINFPEILIQ